MTIYIPIDLIRPMINRLKLEHEYCITYDETDALDALGLELDTEMKQECFDVARKRYLATCEF